MFSGRTLALPASVSIAMSAGSAAPCLPVFRDSYCTLIGQPSYSTIFIHTKIQDDSAKMISESKIGYLRQAAKFRIRMGTLIKSNAYDGELNCGLPK